jgi:lambda family phage portal protein
MAFWDRFIKRNKTANAKRNFYASNSGRLYGDWLSGNTSPDAELQNNLQLMRDRARDLARNNGIVTRYLQIMKEGVVGNSGFKIKLHARDEDGTLDDSGNDIIESNWYDWGRSPEVTNQYTMHDLYQMVVESICRDGEVLCQFIRTEQGLKLSFLEPDYLDSQLNKNLSDTREIRMGIEVDKRTLQPLGYWLKKMPYSNPGTVDSQLTKSVRIDARDMLHIYQPERFGQTRGYPKIASIMVMLKWLNDYQLSELISSKASASKMGFITSPSGDGFAESYLNGDEYQPAMNFEPGTFDQLPTGYDIKFFDPQHPTSQVNDYMRTMMRSIASGLGVSYASLSGDLSQTSYSSARVGLMQERDSFKQMQRFVIEHFCMPVYKEWLLQAMTIDQFGIPVSRYFKFENSANFSGRGYQSVDPLKEAQADILNINQGLATIQDVLSKSGKDLATHFSEIDSQQALAEKFGIDLAYEPYGSKFNPQTGQPFDDLNLNEDSDDGE